MSGPEDRARRTLTEAPADQLLNRLGDELERSYGITRTDLYQVDYRLSVLLPLADGEPITGPGHPAWRCFDHQEPIIAEGTGWFPVGMRGERRGVLRVSPVPADPEVIRELDTISTALGHELAAVTASTDIYRAARRTRRLTLAAEMQWEMLPGRSRIRPSFSLAGQLEPAYAVRGDSFDWSDDGHRLWLSVINGSGEGVAASMLTSLATHALRNARRAELGLADQAALADQAIYALHRGAQHLSALLLELDLATGMITVVDAGSPRLVRVRDGEVSEQVLEKQFPLGMFEGTDYREQRFQLHREDRLFVVSDGVIDATAERIRYGETALDRFLRRTGPMEPLDAVRSLIGDLRAFVAGDLIDDAVVVCLDWLGPQP
ncbi:MULTISPECIES: PP2C family protein-serine/threonine phosphatase [Micromonospora]|uniref:Serine/threonine-protein phosphatase n=1 Tax=Micromonospora solifontis TaxID=2487138 RepID=A0ABX9WJ43_9ACTN|nr:MULTISPECIES: PP2C family protein-serine/threonine phosphatase [Micromonospora]NES15565.1 serine/threonine-protein phosphatase [Micromonospora sp. PPF5-17B]NES35930.1 serine/threonine-protein phosphatase [Micromonospora solifontis]NES56900.1 serine/threonine-protein phosphatase [Micromonospora sp. PPF5-6]RNM00215.1 serine/threonine-protein phosphatase [Micromonospora solifontis]